MNPAELANLLFAAVGLAGMFAAAFMWVGQQKTKQTDQDRRLLALEAKLAGQDSTLLLVTELRAEVKHLSEALDKQPVLIGQVVAVSIRETLRLVAPRQMGAPA